jgi:hypothetical protein
VTEAMVRIEHCIGADGKRYCAPGMRAFARRHGLSLRELLGPGIPASRLEATGDAMAARVAARARKAFDGQQ